MTDRDSAPADYANPALPVDVRVEDLLVTTRLAGSILHASPPRMVEAIELAAGTRLGIPLLTADDCIHGHSFWPGATIFPTQLTMACTWDPALVERAARVAEVEIAATGIHWMGGSGDRPTRGGVRRGGRGRRAASPPRPGAGPRSQPHAGGLLV